MPELPPDAQRIVDASSSVSKIVDALGVDAAALAKAVSPLTAMADRIETGLAERDRLLASPHVDTEMVYLPRDPISHDDAALEKLIRRVVAEELEKRFGPVGGSDSQEG